MSATPNSVITAQGIRALSAVCTAAKTTYADGTNAVLLGQAGPNGSILRRLSAIPRGTLSGDAQLQLYRSDNTNYNLMTTKKMAGATMSQSTEMAPTDFGITDAASRYFAPNQYIYVASGVALAAGIVFDGELADL